MSASGAPRTCLHLYFLAGLSRNFHSSSRQTGAKSSFHLPMAASASRGSSTPKGLLSREEMFMTDLRGFDSKVLTSKHRFLKLSHKSSHVPLTHDNLTAKLCSGI